MKRPVLVLLAGVVVLSSGCGRGEAPPAPAQGATAHHAQSPGYGGAPVAPPAAAVAAPVAAPAAETVPDLPDYPGATKLSFETKPDVKHGFARKVEARFTSPDPFASVVALYQKAIVDKGWTVVGTQSKPTEMEWKLVKGTSEAEIEIEQKAGGPVQIKLEREDR
jgi:hypothetical protein